MASYCEIEGPGRRRVHVVAGRHGVARVGFGEAPGGCERDAGHPVLREAARQLEEYFAGRRREFSLDLEIEGTEFCRQVWDALLAIPYGETRTYADVARAVGRPNASRAVGQANHVNPLAIVIPCHRVVATGGGLGGYGGGLDLKAWLLEMERRGRELEGARR